MVMRWNGALVPESVGWLSAHADGLRKLGVAKPPLRVSRCAFIGRFYILRLGLNKRRVIQSEIHLLSSRLIGGTLLRTGSDVLLPRRPATLKDCHCLAKPKLFREAA